MYIVCVCASFPFRFGCGMRDLIVLVPDQCLYVNFRNDLWLVRRKNVNESIGMSISSVPSMNLDFVRIWPLSTASFSQCRNKLIPRAT